ncbi:bactofilin family protein [Aurantibacillus circumpalustris]|uniref:bactofilin family protein n=1 Tax=Aurantibacillus circumpalustris TaxID=3036359 RepID=UPI00295B8C81|nr:polymer-forming cytoskeletal protein [Aurantibacillus circumpalustris]
MGSNKNQTQDVGSINIIGKGTKIVGDISSAGDVRIDGTLTGNIIITGKLVLGQTGFIDGNITSVNAELEGEVKGIVNISETLSLKATAKVNGDIVTSKLMIEPGALFTGSCNMGAKVKNMVQDSETSNNARAKTA